MSIKTPANDLNTCLASASRLFHAHIKTNTKPAVAARYAFEYIRDLHGFDYAECWRLGIMTALDAIIIYVPNQPE